MPRIYLYFILAFSFLLFSSQDIYAKSTYVLPYPSQMPGSKLYLLTILKDKWNSYWYFGDLAQFSYNLQMADKYLVESKTLFEYNQYLIAENSLKKSNYYYKKLSTNIQNAKNNKKNTSEIENIYIDASRKHIEVLKKLQKELPDEFTWTPEKSDSTNINIQELLNYSISIRNE